MPIKKRKKRHKNKSNIRIKIFMSIIIRRILFFGKHIKDSIKFYILSTIKKIKDSRQKQEDTYAYNKREDKNAISFQKVSKLFADNVGIKNISFEIKKGSFHVLAGSNGSGKTTLIRSLLRLYKSFSGEIFINGIDNKNKKSFEGISYISESAVFPAELSAKSYLNWAGILAGMKKDETQVKVEELATKFNIKKILDKNPNKFSSGQKQKVMLIKILIENAKIIIMDEPTANLDPSARITFFEEIKKIHNNGNTIFICSHNLEEIEDKVTDVTILNQGKITYSKPKDTTRLMDIFKKYGRDV